MTSKLKLGKIFIIIFSVIAAVIAAVIVYYASGIIKISNLKEYASSTGQNIYILGTFHSQHFDKKLGYSIKDIESCIDNIDPDVVYIESRPEIFEKYGVVDGPIDMIFVYSYCQENNIPVKMIDWWEVSDNTSPNTTTDERDDKIYQNISNELEKCEDSDKVLIVCGGTHLREQSKRFEKDNFKNIKIKNPGSYFASEKGGFSYPRDGFSYPKNMTSVIRDKKEYLQNDFPKEIEENVSDDEVKKSWYSSSENLQISLSEIMIRIKAMDLFN